MERGQSYPGLPPVRWGAIRTAAGPVSFATDGTRVRVVSLGQEIRDDRRPSPLDRETARQLRAYFARERTRFDLPLHFDLPGFTKRVLERVERIPFGATLSYGEVAHAVGAARAARAVGQAVGSNPLPLLIPCHRVLAADGRLGGFGCGMAWKRFLLDLEHIAYRAP